MKNEKRTLQQKKTHVILGVDLYTVVLTEALENAGVEDIAVLDYEADDDVMELGDLFFYSPYAARRKFRDGKKVVFHKVLCKKMPY